LPKESSWVQTVKHFFKGDFDEVFGKLIKKNGEIMDGHPLKSLLIVLRITRTDQSKNSIKTIGASKYLLIDKQTAELLDDGDGSPKNPLLLGYSEVNSHRYFVIDCGIEGGEPSNE